jgi:hypothetical protein
MINNDNIIRLQKTKLFLSLIDKEKEDCNLSNKVINIVKEVYPLLQRIPENMPEYTLHDPDHSAKIVEIMSDIIPEQVLLNLNIIEISLLILSAYLHDIGMTCDRKEKENIIKNNVDYNILFKSNVDKHQKFEQYKLEGNHRAATFIEDQIFTEYLRRNHVKRSGLYIQETLSCGEFILSYNGIPFYKLLVKICDAHGEPVKKLYDLNIWPKQTLVGKHIINVQYLSLILRLADILDLDSERTPSVIYEFVNPEDPISIIEWKKHKAILGTSITSSIILFEAECSSPEVERALRQFMDWIEIERRESIELLKTYKSEENSRYFLQLNEPITKDRIHSDGSYIYNDLIFSLDYHRIMSLLMGQKLYKDPTTALRELLQNSIDAIKVRQKIYEGKTDKINPFIKLSIKENILTIEDNGIGMDEQIFKEYFLQIGKSYYSSPIFYSRYSGMDIISEFGIGILSVFMIASSFSIESRKEPDDPLNPFLPIKAEIPTAHSFLIQKESKRKEIGTTLTLKLAENNLLRGKNILQVLEQIIPNPPYPITIVDNGIETIYKGKKWKDIPLLTYDKDTTWDFFSKYKVYDTFWMESYTHYLFKINFDDDDDLLAGIKGELLIVNANPVNFDVTLKGDFCQRDFAIGFPKTIETNFTITPTPNINDLFPLWVNCFSNLNFTGESCLSITPDRSDVTIDEKFKLLKNKIEKKIITAYKKHFEDFKNSHGEEELNIYINFLYVSGFFGIPMRNREITLDNFIKFLNEYFKFPILNDDGDIKFIKGQDLFTCRNIGLVSEQNHEMFKNADIIEFKKKNDIEIIIMSKLHYSSYRTDTLIKILMGGKGPLISPLKLLLKPVGSLQIQLLKYNNKCAIEDNDYDIIEVISNSDDINIDISVLFILRHAFFPRYNKTHPILSFLFDDDHKAREKFFRLRNKLSRDVSKTIEASIDILKQSNNIDLVKLGHSSDNYMVFKGIFNRDQNLFLRFDELFSKLWDDAREMGLIDKSRIKPELKKSDFPWYWWES